MLNRWKKYFSEILNVNGVIDSRHTEIHTAKPLVPEPSYFEAEITFKNFERYKSPCIGQIPIELIQAGSKILCSQIHRFMIFCFE
jgi:hypothetical protein